MTVGTTRLHEKMQNFLPVSVKRCAAQAQVGLDLGVKT